MSLNVFKSAWSVAILGITGMLGFVCSYVLEITANNADQYLGIASVVLLDGFFGIWAGVLREGFKTYKAIKVLKTMFAWIFILTVILSVEQGFDGTFWLSETIITPFIVFKLISALKNASMAGFIQMDLLNTILDKIDQHKGERNAGK